MAKMTMEQFQRKLKRWRKDFPKEIGLALLQSGNEIIGEAQMSHLSGPYMGYKRTSVKHATLQPRTGDLKTKWSPPKVKSSSRETSLKVGTNVKYAAAHEYGYPKGGIPKRAFLWPSVEEKKPGMLERISKAMVAAYYAQRST